eukprot:TRINITY_DN27984_c0_g1_i1.p1 TRINITY_DN27984_c0_g1~~TRINITY_DN27984_c0_g1_i1.p1  ORF type:complete len:350 (+),score=48.90 TRINITY_DN27984_c0_g1_i1:28-1077(+)
MQRVASREYFQWRLSKRIQGIIMQDVSPKNAPRVLKALEIFCMSNWDKNTEWPNLYGRILDGNKDENGFFLRKLQSDIQSLGVSEPTAKGNIKKMVEEVKRSRQRFEREGSKDLPITETSNYVTVGKLRERKTPRIRKMIQMSGLYATAAVILRYQAALADSTQWSIPDSVYDVLMNDLGCSAEGYASPLNSYMMLHNKPYCSLYTDVDSNFDSLGPITSIKDPLQVSDSWVLNPPYTLYHLNNTANIMKRWLQMYPNMRIVLIGREHNRSGVGVSTPKMQRVSPYATIEPFARARIDLAADNYKYENSKGEAVVASFGSVMYVCGRPLDGTQALEKITDEFALDDVAY